MAERLISNAFLYSNWPRPYQENYLIDQVHLILIPGDKFKGYKPSSVSYVFSKHVVSSNTRSLPNPNLQAVSCDQGNILY